MNSVEGQTELRVLVVPPTTRDGVVTHALLSRVGIDAVICHDLRSACSELQLGAAALLLTSAALSSDVSTLLSYLEAQPSWSDLPIVLLMKGGHPIPKLEGILPALGNVTLLERPAAA